MAVQRVFRVECDCEMPIPLPPQSLLGIFQHPQCQPTDMWPVAFQCPDCERVFVRRPGNVVLRGIEAPVRYPPRSTVLWQVELGCDREGCEATAAIYLLDEKAQSEASVRDLSEQANLSGVTCAVGHGLSRSEVRKLKFVGRLYE